MLTQCSKCKSEIHDYWLKYGICNGCRNPSSVVVSTENESYNGWKNYEIWNDSGLDIEALDKMIEEL